MARRIITLSVEDDNNEFVFLTKHSGSFVEVLENRLVEDDEHDRVDLLIDNLNGDRNDLAGALEKLSDEEVELVKNDILSSALLAVRDEVPALSVDATQKIVRTVNDYAANHFG